MRRPSRNYDWGFPRWRDYGADREAARVRACDREGCADAGDRPAPKSPNSPERWWFCERHAAEYNKGWDYFAGLTAEEAAARADAESRDQRGYSRANHWQQWGGAGDGSRSRAEMDALRALELEDSDGDEQTIKRAYRRLAKAYHPDVNRGDAEAAAKFQAVQAAYELLRRAAEQREAKPR